MFKVNFYICQSGRHRPNYGRLVFYPCTGPGFTGHFVGRQTLAGDAGGGPRTRGSANRFILSVARYVNAPRETEPISRRCFEMAGRIFDFDSLSTHEGGAFRSRDPEERQCFLSELFSRAKVLNLFRYNPLSPS